MVADSPGLDIFTQGNALTRLLNWNPGAPSLFQNVPQPPCSDDCPTPTLPIIADVSAGGSAYFTPNAKGFQGEVSVLVRFNIGNRYQFTVAGRRRIADGWIENNSISEVQNVQRLTYTLQLKDYVQAANSRGITFNLYVNEGAQLSWSLIKAWAAGSFNVIFYEPLP
jgi:Restriction endonuclease fold toxin 7